MNGNNELLNYIYRNSAMGVITIDKLVEYVGDANFRAQLETQYEGYCAIHKEARGLLGNCGLDEKGLTSFQKMRTEMMVRMQTVCDRSNSHIAEMLIIGSNMGVIDAIRNLRKYTAAKPEIRALMERLQAFEEGNIHALKAFI